MIFSSPPFFIFFSIYLLFRLACHLLPSGTSRVAGKIYEKIRQDIKPAR
jgi:hypothetical protein